VIRIVGVSKRFGPRSALREVTLEAPAGEVTAVIGPNGAGKSTLLKAVVGLVRPDAGAVHLGDHDVARRPEEARRLAGYVPQRLVFPEHLVCEDLCRLVGTLRGVPVEASVEALDHVALADRRLSRVRDLSGGQRQRLSLTLALIGSPRALVLDEPSISLDTDGAELVCRAIAETRAHGAAVLFASHQLHEVAALADRVVVLAAGLVVASAPAARIRDTRDFENFYREAVGARAAA
jgi:ABC-type multidrug transport system ATPase subunit